MQELAGIMLTMSAPAAGPARVGWFMRLSRGDLGLSLTRAAELTGISRPQWTAIENGEVENPYEPTLAAIEKTLHWERGSWAATVRGGEPVVLSVPEPDVPRRFTPVEHWRIVVAALEDPDIDWDYPQDMLELLAKRARAKLKLAQERAKQGKRDVG